MSAENRLDQAKPSRAFLFHQLRPLAEHYSRFGEAPAQDLLALLVLIAEQYGEPTWWDEQKDTAGWSIVTRLAPLAAWLLRDRTPIEAFKLVRREDLAQIHARARRLSELIRDDRYLTADELADRLDAFQAHLAANRDALIRTGFPETQFVGWPAPLLAHHYYVKLPDNIFDEDDPPPSDQPPRQWIWARPATEAEEGERRARQVERSG